MTDDQWRPGNSKINLRWMLLFWFDPWPYLVHISCYVHAVCPFVRGGGGKFSFLKGLSSLSYLLCPPPRNYKSSCYSFLQRRNHHIIPNHGFKYSFPPVRLLCHHHQSGNVQNMYNHLLLVQIPILPYWRSPLIVPVKIWVNISSGCALISFPPPLLQSSEKTMKFHSAASTIGRHALYTPKIKIGIVGCVLKVTWIWMEDGCWVYLFLAVASGLMSSN